MVHGENENLNFCFVNAEFYRVVLPINSLFATFADLHVRKRATFADLHSYTHAYCSFALLNEAITIVFGLHCLHALLIWLFGILHTIYR